MEEKKNKTSEAKLMKGNEALAEAAIRAEIDAYFGYPITPQSEVLEYLEREIPNVTDWFFRLKVKLLQSI
jgi:2-oxoglutarate ferredoxin oxidoreductase subunit alpha